MLRFPNAGDKSVAWMDTVLQTLTWKARRIPTQAHQRNALAAAVPASGPTFAGVQADAIRGPVRGAARQSTRSAALLAGTRHDRSVRTDRGGPCWAPAVPVVTHSGTEDWTHAFCAAGQCQRLQSTPGLSRESSKTPALAARLCIRDV